MKETILCFAAHPDDEVIGIGGAIGAFKNEGKRVITVIFSGGEHSSPWLKKDYLVGEREREAIRIGEFIGSDETIILGFKDMNLDKDTARLSSKKRIEKIIRRYRPTQIFVHSSLDPHKDHKAVNKSVLEAVEKIDKKNNISVFSYEVWNVLNEITPRIYIDVSDTFKKKIEAMKKFRSQKIYVYILMLPVIIRCRIAGLHIGVKYAERFYKIR